MRFHLQTRRALGTEALITTATTRRGCDEKMGLQGQVLTTTMTTMKMTGNEGLGMKTVSSTSVEQKSGPL
jgi:hypothetical protein